MLILDTQVWLWWLHEPTRLSVAAREAITREEGENGLRVSTISVWEIATKTQLGKLALPLDINVWFERAKAYPGITIEALHPADAIASTQLPGNFHKDPSDRIIVALARRYGAALVSCDERIIAYPHVKTVW